MSEKVEPIKVVPITPDEAMKVKLAMIPDLVIDVYNRLIIRNLKIDNSGHSAEVFDREAIAEIIQNAPKYRYTGVTEYSIEKDGWLYMVGEVYRENGWIVRSSREYNYLSFAYEKNK